jgi:hypothetical protein
MKNNKQGYILFILLLSTALFSNCRKEKIKPEQADSFIKYYGKSGNQKAGNVVATNDGGYILVGTTDAYGNGKQILVVKTDAYGNEQWNKVFGGAGDDEAYNIQVTPDGGYVLAGSKAEGNSSINTDAWILKLNSQGEEAWSKTYGTAGKNDVLNRIIISWDNGYVAVGTTTSINSTKPGGTSSEDISDAYLLKTTSEGLLQWIGVTGVKVADAGTSVQQIADTLFITSISSIGSSFLLPPDGYDMNIITGRTALNNTQYAYVSNINKQGSVSENNISDAIQLIHTSDGDYIVGNTKDKKIYLLKILDNGSKVFYKEFNIGAESLVSGFSRNSDGTFIIAGSKIVNGDSDALVIYCDPNGAEIWSRTFGYTGNDQSASVIQTKDGGFIVSATMQFGGNSTGSNNVFTLIHVNADGNLK